MKKKDYGCRHLDNLGRIVLPIEIRQKLELEPGDMIDIFMDGQSVVLQKFIPGCVLCGATENTVEHKGRSFCRSCLAELKALE